jgi:hypothetical protein
MGLSRWPAFANFDVGATNWHDHWFSANEFAPTISPNRHEHWFSTNESAFTISAILIMEFITNQKVEKLTY